MRSRLLAILLAIGSCTHAMAQCAALPESVQRYLSSQSGWTVVDTNDLVRADQLLWQRQHARLCPGMAAVDLDGQGSVSYALALLNRESRKEQLVVLHQQAGGISADVLAQPDRITSPFVVWRARLGMFRDRATGREISVPHDVFVYEKLEANATIYYIADGQYRSILASN